MKWFKYTFNTDNEYLQILLGLKNSSYIKTVGTFLSKLQCIHLASKKPKKKKVT